jgi:hypothetical protein
MAVFNIPIGTSVVAANAIISGAAPGDTVALQKGIVLNGVIRITNNGALDNPITLTSYGAGARPIITTRTSFKDWANPSNWSLYSTNVWMYSDTANPRDILYRIWIDGVEGIRANTPDAVNSVHNLYSSRLLPNIYVYSTSNPATAFTSMEYSSDETSTLNCSASHWVFDGLDVRGSVGASFDLAAASYILVQNCNIGMDTSRLSFRAFGKCSNVIFRYNEVDSGDRTIDTVVWQKGVGDGLYISTGCHNWEVYGNWIHDCGHSLIEVANTWPNTSEIQENGYTLSNIYIHDNLLTGEHVDYSRGFGCDSIQGYPVTNIVFTRNKIDKCPIASQINCPGLVFSYNLVTNSRVTPSIPDAGNALTMAGYSNTSPINMRIYNNVFANHPEAAIMINWVAGYGYLYGNDIANNIIYNCGTDPQDTFLTGVQMKVQPYSDSTGYMHSNTFRNNILWRIGGGHVYYDNRVSSQTLTIEDMNAQNGINGDTIVGNQQVDPLFVDALADFYLQPSSPAIGNGATLGNRYKTGIVDGSVWPNEVIFSNQSQQAWGIGPYVNPQYEGLVRGFAVIN